ncbi:hypothetical protein SPRG_17123, partial [Saprolegnia parasitica CBS 223.65]
AHSTAMSFATSAARFKCAPTPSSTATLCARWSILTRTRTSSSTGASSAFLASSLDLFSTRSFASKTRCASKRLGAGSGTTSSAGAKASTRAATICRHTTGASRPSPGSIASLAAGTMPLDCATLPSSSTKRISTDCNLKHSAQRFYSISV